MQMVLIIPMTAIQSQIHKGSVMDGIMTMAAQTTKTKSAMLSILEPNSLTEFSFLAMKPSIMSENPPQQ